MQFFNLYQNGVRRKPLGSWDGQWEQNYWHAVAGQNWPDLEQPYHQPLPTKPISNSATYQLKL